MKKLCFMLLSFLIFHPIESTPRKHVIGYWHAYLPNGRCNIVGFFSAFLAVINNIAWAKKHNRIPLVYWDDYSLYYQPEGYNGATNVWEYYFEPISDIAYDPTHDPTPYYEYGAPDGTGFVPFKPLKQQEKEEMHAIIRDYIRIKKPIQKKIDAFYDAHMAGKKVIGIHLRGTDKCSEAEVVGTTDYLEIANNWASQQKEECIFFVATDEEQLLEKAKEGLNGTVYHWDSCRSIDGKAVHHKTNHHSPAKKGEEVLIETILLSRCDVIIRGHSNIAYTATFFNPAIEDILVEPKRFIIGPVSKKISTTDYERHDIFISLFSVLVHAYWCEKNGRIPVVYWDHRSPYFNQAEHYNAWTYFFEPLNQTVWQEGDSVHFSATTPAGMSIETGLAHSYAYRLMVHNLIKRFIKIREPIIRSVQTIKNMMLENVPIIGIHLASAHGYSNQASPLKLIEAANHAAARYESCAFFVVADEPELLNFADQYLSKHPIFTIPHNPDSLPQQQGARLLTEALVLAECDMLVHSHANLAYAATFFNPELPTILVETATYQS